METPILDFVTAYAKEDPIRLHMPGHKGQTSEEAWDITEIEGADELFAAHGIIAQSEANASAIFGVPTFYSAAGSTLCIQSMLYLLQQYSRRMPQFCPGRGKPRILAARNAHKAFLNATALLDLEVEWLVPGGDDRRQPYYVCPVSPQQVAQELAQAAAEGRPFAGVYVTSPDYLGNICDVKEIARVCHENGALLLVDNAHGAYLKFLPGKNGEPSMHPMDLGADMCCDSAHKTLPVLTGGAYLHVGGEQVDFLRSRAKEAMSLFGSSSPSYLIMTSLDRCNVWMEQGREHMAEFLPLAKCLREKLTECGYTLAGEEELKVSLHFAKPGISGDLARFLHAHHIYDEFCDPEFLVFMLSPMNTEQELMTLARVLREYAGEHDITEASNGRNVGRTKGLPKRVMSPREAILAEKETLPIEECLGRVSASAAISCPPAVPIVVCGEEIDEEAIAMFRFYGIESCKVVK